MSAGFLSGGGAVGALIGARDWSSSALGPIERWPSQLKSLLATVLHAPHPMLLWWGADLLQFYNDAFVPSLGVGKHPEALGQRGRESWAEVWPIVGAQIERVMSTGESTFSEDALVPIERNGRIEEVYWSYGYSSIMDDEGRIAGTLIVCNETTARVVAQRRLAMMRALVERTAGCTDLSSVLDASFEVVATATHEIPFAVFYRIDHRGRTARRERATALDDRLLAAVDELAQAVAVSPNTEPSLVALPPLPFPGGAGPEPATQAFVLPLRGTSGMTLLFGVNPRVPFDATYRAFMLDFAQDLELATVRVRAIERHGGVEAERRNLLLQAPMPTALLTGPEHVFELANAPYEKMVGRKVVGKTYLQAFPELAGTALPGILDAVLRTGEPFVAPESLVRLDRRSDGTMEDCYFRFVLEPIRDTRGNIYGMMAVAFDITEQVNARHALEESVREARRLHEKAAHAEEALRSLLRQLESANLAKDEFLATVSHELRTPLTAILGWSRMLSDGIDPANAKKGLQVIERNAKAQAKLIEDLLDVSRIITGKLRMSMKRVDLGTIARAAVETALPSAEARGIRLNVTIGADLGDIVADEERLQQIIWNLLSNAVKFTPRGGEISLEVTRAESQVAITVIDNGKGISPQFLPHVFDRFRQDDSSTTKQHAGLGLGLAIVRHLVELHGGSVSARSEGEGKGARFDVILPIRAVDMDIAGPHAPPPPASAGSAGRLSNAHVLVLDDQEDARELLTAVLESEGATVSQADSVATAMRSFSDRQVDIIVSDIGMPGEDGYTFIRWLRTSGDSPRTRELPALALTAYARAEDRERALASGFQEHVTKPVDPAKLIDVVATLIHR